MQLRYAISAAAALVVLGCMGSGGGVGSTNGTTAGGGTTVNVTMGAMDFSPQVVNAHAGDTVKWTNPGATPHTVTSDTGEPGLSSPTMNAGSTFSWSVPASAAVGTHFFYHCVFHGTAGNGSSLGTGMAGEITVN